MTRQSLRIKPGRRSRIEVVHEADEAAVVLEVGAVSGADVGEGVAEDSKATADNWNLISGSWFLLFTGFHVELQRVNWIFALSQELMHGWMAVGLLAFVDMKNQEQYFMRPGLASFSSYAWLRQMRII